MVRARELMMMVMVTKDESGAACLRDLGRRRQLSGPAEREHVAGAGSATAFRLRPLPLLTSYPLTSLDVYAARLRTEQTTQKSERQLKGFSHILNGHSRREARG